MAWWDRAQYDGPPVADRLRSLYENRSPRSRSRLVFANGRFVEVEPCCDQPLLCERSECWRP